jgi:hypothetical protein
VIATLQTTYGGDPMGGLRMPFSVLNAYVAMLPRMVARGALNRVTEHALGAGSMKQHQAKEILRAWRREARERPSGQISRPSREDHHAALRSMGIEVEEVSSG